MNMLAKMEIHLNMIKKVWSYPSMFLFGTLCFYEETSTYSN